MAIKIGSRVRVLPELSDRTDEGRVIRTATHADDPRHHVYYVGFPNGDVVPYALHELDDLEATGCQHERIASDPMGGEWCQDCGAVKPPYVNWLSVIFGATPDRKTPGEWPPSSAI